ncbi:hypothetical protein K439DRAFT_645522 [Ramaria rubella]|nr:hypothetical protein K439DRAFT_645522 [Ramaria rubella]
MDTLSIVNHNAFLTTVVSSHDQSALYTIRSSRYSGYVSSDIYRENDEEFSKPQTKLATVSYLNLGTTRVAFGLQEVDLDTFLRKRSMYNNSRIFVGPDGETYKWRIKGDSVELYDLASHTLLARSHPLRSSLNIFSTKTRSASLEVSQRYTLGTGSPMLDVIVLTYVIMEHLLQARRRLWTP